MRVKIISAFTEGQTLPASVSRRTASRLVRCTIVLRDGAAEGYLVVPSEVDIGAEETATAIKRPPTEV